MGEEVHSQFSEDADIETATQGYASRFQGPAGEYFLEAQTRLTLELMRRWPEATVLDVGGGHAQLAVPLARAGYRVTVTGSSSACANRLESSLGQGLLDFRCCDMLNLPFERREFDIVIAFRLLPHVHQWQRLVGELCRVARHAVVVDYPDRRSFNFVQGLFFGWKKAVEKNTRPFRCFTRTQLAAEFAKHGFGRPDIRPEFFWPMVLHRALNRGAFSRSLEAVSRALGLTSTFGSPVIMRVHPSKTVEPSPTASAATEAPR